MTLPTLPSTSVPDFLTAHPSFTPTPTPHFRLPDPCSDYCLSLYAREDRKDVKDIIQDPHHETWRESESSMTDADAEQACDWYEKKFEDNSSSWPFVIIREIAHMKDWSSSDPASRPPVIGLLFFGPNAFRDTAWDDEERLKQRDLNLASPDKDRHWMSSFFMDTSHRGKGLMTVALKFVLETWYLGLNPPPGHMASGWEVGNMPSQKLHLRAGFKLMGRRPQREDEDFTTLVSLWSGAGEIRKEDSIYNGTPDV